jgi:nucleotide-binding universal stress UspA family protein
MTERLIVVGTDGSPGGRRALEWALRHAAGTGAAVEVVSAWSWDGPDWAYRAGPGDERAAVDAEQENEVQNALAALDARPTVSRTVTEGNPIDVLTRAAAKADLLVLGSHGRSHLVTALLGSVSEGCIRHGSTPVVVVPAHSEARQPADVVPAGRSRSE